MSSAAGEPATPSRNVGTRTLARGLRALELVAAAPDGVSIQDVAAALDVHRTVAYRLLSTLGDFRLVTRGPDGRFRPGAGLAALAAETTISLRDVATPHMRDLAAELESTVSLLVAEGDEAVAIAVVEPTNARYHLSFRRGSRHPIERGAAGIALLSARPPQPSEPAEVTQARRAGYASTHGQVEPGAYGVAVPLRPVPGMPDACVNVITYRQDVAERAADPTIAAVRRIDEALAGPDRP
ncbi:IclR family transcriptional regulator [Actinomadura hallensis]|uniref:IclR family transcriptional regulator n=1 Tax=Actinomadura hallensis TaxID=337895 RepID=A0A543IGR0_9ACTN|nr:helix-turn-helix domain-containing protein [Actinomadura hallensis]TQM69768.1 IclR family transcriptional regulator [Actinomadura hallensis]